jgi:hypothetical protein
MKMVEKKKKKANKNQMEEIKRESDVLRYNLMKFDLVYLKSILKMRLNLGNITK